MSTVYRVYILPLCGQNCTKTYIKKGYTSNTFMEPTTQATQPQEIITPTPSQGDEFHKKRNIYPLVRHVFIIAFTLAILAIVIFLIYQNGKSIYDNGL